MRDIKAQWIARGIAVPSVAELHVLDVAAAGCCVLLGELSITLGGALRPGSPFAFMMGKRAVMRT